MPLSGRLVLPLRGVWACWAAARKTDGDTKAILELIDVLLLHRVMNSSDVTAGITAALSVGAVSADVVAVEARRSRRTEHPGVGPARLRLTEKWFQNQTAILKGRQGPCAMTHDARESVVLASAICAREDESSSARVLAAARAIRWVWMVVMPRGLRTIAFAGPFRLRAADSARWALALDHPVTVTSSSRITPLAVFDDFT